MAFVSLPFTAALLLLLVVDGSSSSGGGALPSTSVAPVGVLTLALTRITLLEAVITIFAKNNDCPDTLW